MKTLDQIKHAIQELPFEQRAELAEWFVNWHDDDEWDRQMSEDARAARLDPLIKRADDAIRRSDLQDTP